MTFTDEEVSIIRAGLAMLQTHQITTGGLPDPNLPALIERVRPVEQQAAPEVALEA